MWDKGNTNVNGLKVLNFEEKFKLQVDAFHYAINQKAKGNRTHSCKDKIEPQSFICRVHWISLILIPALPVVMQASCSVASLWTGVRVFGPLQTRKIGCDFNDPHIYTTASSK